MKQRLDICLLQVSSWHLDILIQGLLTVKFYSFTLEIDQLLWTIGQSHRMEHTITIKKQTKIQKYIDTGYKGLKYIHIHIHTCFFSDSNNFSHSFFDVLHLLRGQSVIIITPIALMVLQFKKCYIHEIWQSTGLA